MGTKCCHSTVTLMWWQIDLLNLCTPTIDVKVSVSGIFELENNHEKEERPNELSDMLKIVHCHFGDLCWHIPRKANNPPRFHLSHGRFYSSESKSYLLMPSCCSWGVNQLGVWSREARMGHVREAMLDSLIGTPSSNLIWYNNLWGWDVNDEELT